MTAPQLSEHLLIALRGTGAERGLARLELGAQSATLIAPVDMLMAIARHPRLDIVYGAAGNGGEGTLHAWRLNGDRAEAVATGSSGGVEPCHVAVDPAGRILVATNYGSGSIAIQALDEDGSFAGVPVVVGFEGSGPDADRQEAAHPHQALFVEDRLVVVDLGADALREFAWSTQSGSPALTPGHVTVLPPGAGPRHAVVLPDGRLAVTGELDSTLLVGRLGEGPEHWTAVASTRREGRAKTRTPRNYPGDIALSPDGRTVHLANRGHDTIASFDVSGDPVMIDERDAGAAWPQHLHALADGVLVACEDGGVITRLPTGKDEAAARVASMPGPAWLLPLAGTR